MRTLHDELAAISDPRERHQRKVHALAGLTNLPTIKHGKYTVAIVDGPKIADAHDGTPLLTFSLRITKGGKDVTPADLNPIRVYNPPILVDDPNGEVVRTWNDPNTGIPQTRRLREDPREAMLSVVRDLAKQRLG